MKAPAEFTYDQKKPIVCTAIHTGSFLSRACSKNMSLENDNRMREEDSYTDQLAKLYPNNIIANYSRFEVDLNRKRDASFYLLPEDAWGLQVREEEPDKSLIDSSYKKYDDFYDNLNSFFTEIRQTFDKIIVFDIHSYNHRRKGPDKEPADQQNNPDIVLGTGNMPDRWNGLVDQLEHHFTKYKIKGKPLDVRKNVKFTGGWFSHWLHYTFPGSVCCISIEFKKIFMDEWTGELDPKVFSILKEALKKSFPIVESYLCKD